MRHIGKLSTIFAVALVAGFWLGATPAEAGIGWTVGGTFSVGGFDFGIFYRPDHHGPYAYDHYYRTARSPRYRGHRCHDRCYRDRGFDYHWAGCPLIRHHFHRHRFNPAAVLDVVFNAPRGYWRYGYRDRGRHYRYDRRYYRDHHRYRHDYCYRGHRGRYRSFDDDSDSDSHRRYLGRRDGYRFRGHDDDSDSDSYRRGRRGSRRDDYRSRRRP